MSAQTILTSIETQITAILTAMGSDTSHTEEYATYDGRKWKRVELDKLLDSLTRAHAYWTKKVQATGNRGPRLVEFTRSYGP